MVSAATSNSSSPLTKRDRADEFLAAGDFVLMLERCGFKNKSTGNSFVTPKANLW